MDVEGDDENEAAGEDDGIEIQEIEVILSIHASFI